MPKVMNDDRYGELSPGTRAALQSLLEKFNESMITECRKVLEEAWQGHAALFPQEMVQQHDATFFVCGHERRSLRRAEPRILMGSSSHKRPQISPRKVPKRSKVDPRRGSRDSKFDS